MFQFNESGFTFASTNYFSGIISWNLLVSQPRASLIFLQEQLGQSVSRTNLLSHLDEPGAYFESVLGNWTCDG